MTNIDTYCFIIFSPNSETAFEPNGVINNDGSVFLVTVNRFETNNCKTKQDGGTECSFKFGSWTYPVDLIDLKLMNEEVDLSNYQEDAAYKLVNTTAQRNDVIYPCCPESYPDVTYTVTMQPVQPELAWL